MVSFSRDSIIKSSEGIWRIFRSENRWEKNTVWASYFRFFPPSLLLFLSPSLPSSLPFSLSPPLFCLLFFLPPLFMNPLLYYLSILYWQVIIIIIIIPSIHNILSSVDSDFCCLLCPCPCILPLFPLPYPESFFFPYYHLTIIYWHLAALPTSQCRQPQYAISASRGHQETTTRVNPRFTVPIFLPFRSRKPTITGSGW